MIPRELELRHGVHVGAQEPDAWATRDLGCPDVQIFLLSGLEEQDGRGSLQNGSVIVDAR